MEAYKNCYTVLLRMFKLKHADFGLSKSPANSSVLDKDAESFCDQVIPDQSPYCYPQVLDGPQLPDADPQDTSGSLNCICGQPVASGLRNPLVATHSGDRSGRLFVVEQIGAIRIVTADNILLPQAFLDISSEVLTSSRVGEERGMLGLAFHPNYVSNGKFYVYYSASVNNAHCSRVSEFTVSTGEWQVLDIAVVCSMGFISSIQMTPILLMLAQRWRCGVWSSQPATIMVDSYSSTMACCSSSWEMEGVLGTPSGMRSTGDVSGCWTCVGHVLNMCWTCCCCVFCCPLIFINWHVH